VLMTSSYMCPRFCYPHPFSLLALAHWHLTLQIAPHHADCVHVCAAYGWSCQVKRSASKVTSLHRKIHQHRSVGA
jgi:hypothetical protein